MNISTTQGTTTILTHRPDSTCHYIDRISLNGKRSGYRIEHRDLLGSTIEITTTNKQ